ncbi:ion transporter [Curvibacter sp. CHRR-16]|uniref:ion transporter n=1 Tax=Curvibacter sp. CHRR-16 TaxID=2835872 RepID=UPI001BD9CC0D|nr:ion transporter [Curvibacter sp. CHRR-16]MBT0569140.1 ion transporter [Curvibacter sp. CHRR-16]
MAHTTVLHLRRQLFHILHKPSPENPMARYVNYLLALLIVSNATLVAVESMPGWSASARMLFRSFEWVSTSIFAVEYIARLWTCVEQGHFYRPVWGRVRYAFTPLAVLDLIVIATIWGRVDLRFLRVARMIRLLKVLHLEHLHEALDKVGTALARRRELLIVSLLMMVLCIYVSAALLYLVERQAQPTVFSSIPATLWWAMTTLTTIGYGDMVPITVLGKVCAGMVSVFGIGVFALPVAIVTAAIVEAGASDPTTVSHSSLCTHCQQKIHTPNEKP